MHKQRIVMLVLAAVGALGTFLPWLNVPLVGAVTGTAGGGPGWITLALFAATLIAVVARDRHLAMDAKTSLLAAAPALCAALFALYKIIDFRSAMVNDTTDNPIAKAISESVTLGAGLVLILAMGIVTPIAAFVLRARHDSNDASSPPSPVAASLSKEATRRVIIGTAVAATLIVVGVVASRALSNPREISLTQENKAESLKKVREATSITEEEKGLVTSFMARADTPRLFGSADAPRAVWDGKTVAQVIDKERAWQDAKKAAEAKQAALAAEAKAKAEKLRAELAKTVGLAVTEKGLVAGDAYGITKNLTFNCDYENTSGKDIRAFQGSVVFKDLFGAIIYRTGLKIADPLAAGAKSTLKAGTHYNDFMEDQRKFAATELKDMKVEWTPRTVLFADGTQLNEVETDE